MWLVDSQFELAADFSDRTDSRNVPISTHYCPKSFCIKIIKRSSGINVSPHRTVDAIDVAHRPICIFMALMKIKTLVKQKFNKGQEVETAGIEPASEKWTTPGTTGIFGGLRFFTRWHRRQSRLAMSR